MRIAVNGKPVELTGETILTCKACKGNLWASQVGALYCPACESSRIAPQVVAEHLTAREQSLLDSLRGVVRIVEALRYTTALGNGQQERLAAARAIIARLEAK